MTQSKDDVRRVQLAVDHQRFLGNPDRTPQEAYASARAEALMNGLAPEEAVQAGLAAAKELRESGIVRTTPETLGYDRRLGSGIFWSRDQRHSGSRAPIEAQPQWRLNAEESERSPQPRIEVRPPNGGVWVGA